MNKIFIILALLITSGIAYLAVAGNKVQEIRTEIEISAPPSEVWEIIVDVDRWQEWSPIIDDSKGVVSVGSTLSITMTGKVAGEKGPKYDPVIIDLNEPNYFHWRAHMLAGFIFTNDKIFELEKTETGTRLTHIETFKGLLAPLFCDQMEEGVPPMLNSMNRALKELAEK